MKENKPDLSQADAVKKEVKDANQCMMIGAGVGVAGIGAALAGAACPLCAVAAPGLIGAGLFKRLYLKFRRKNRDRG